MVYRLPTVLLVVMKQSQMCLAACLAAPCAASLCRQEGGGDEGSAGGPDAGLRLLSTLLTEVDGLQDSQGERRSRAAAAVLSRPGPAAGLTASSLLYDVSLPEPGAPFNLQVTRRATGQPIFDTTAHQ